MKKFAIVSFCLIAMAVLMISSSFAQRVAVPVDSNLRPLGIEKGNPLPTISGDLAQESFEGTFPPDGWKKETINGNPAFEGWQQLDQTGDVPGFAAGSGPITAPDGGGDFVAYSGWISGDQDGDFNTGDPTDQWLMTPQITNVQTGDTLKFQLNYFGGCCVENLDILISTDSDTSTDFTVVVDELSFSTAGTGWVGFAYALTDFVAAGSDIFIAFREHITSTATDGDALFLDLVEVTSIVSSVDEDELVPTAFTLEQNYPNPFNPSTKIAFSVPQRTEVKLEVYNVLGQLVATPINNQVYNVGEHSLTFDASSLTNGIYFYKIEAGNFVDVKKMTLLK